MASYGYIAIDRTGKELKGSLNADSEEKVAQELKHMGMIPIEITEQSIWTRDLDISFDRKPGARDLSVFCRQFVSMSKVGVPIVENLRMLVEETENKSLKKALEAVRAGLEKGEGLADSMREHPGIFPELMINMVAAGESSGSLDTAMERMSIQFEKTAKNRALVKKAMVYPTVVALVALAVVVVMLVVVIPSYSDMFETLEAELPWITVAALAASNFLKTHWLTIILVILAAVIILKAYSMTDAGKHLWAEFQFRFPLIQNLVVKSAASHMSRTLGTLMSVGIPMVEAVDIVANTMTNILVKEALLDAKEQIMMGIPLSVPLEESKIFPPMVYHMMRIGEEAGTTEEMLDKLADYFDEEVEVAVQSLMAVIEPMIIVFMALIVGALVACVIAPMLKMYDALDAI